MSALYKFISTRNSEINIFSTIYSVFIAFFPIISIYGFGQKGITIGDFLLAIFAVFSIIRFKFTILNKRSWIVLCFVSYIFIIGLSMGLLFAQDQFISVLVRTIRISFYLITSVLLLKYFFNIKIFKKVVIFLSFFATTYIIIQYVFYYGFGKILHGYLSFIPVYVDEYTQIDYQSFYNVMFRPTSFFLEPAHCARYLILGLIISLFDSILKYRKLSIYFSLGLILTTSGQGLIGLFLVWVIYFIYVFFKEQQIVAKNYGSYLFLALSLLIVGYLLLFGSNGIVDGTLSRLFNNESQLDMSNTGAINARLGNFSYIFNRNIGCVLLGNGYGSVPYENAWLSSLAYFLYGGGLIGTTIFIFFLVFNFKSFSIMAKILVIVSMLFFITDDLFNGYMIVFYCSFIGNYQNKGNLYAKSLVFNN